MITTSTNTDLTAFKIARALRGTDQCSPKFDPLVALLWHSLPHDAQETLVNLCRLGPTWDGDVPSKGGRDQLVSLGLASKAVVKNQQGYQVANYLGWAVFSMGYVIEAGEQR